MEFWPFLLGVIGSLSAVLLLRDLRRGSAWWSWVRVHRMESPSAYWSAMAVNTIGTAMCLGAALFHLVR